MTDSPTAIGDQIWLASKLMDGWRIPRLKSTWQEIRS